MFPQDLLDYEVDSDEEWEEEEPGESLSHSEGVSMAGACKFWPEGSLRQHLNTGFIAILGKPCLLTLTCLVVDRVVPKYFWVGPPASCHTRCLTLGPTYLCSAWLSTPTRI